MAKRIKLHPLSKHFTVDQFEYIQRACKLISWPVDIQYVLIYLPSQSTSLSDTEDLTIKHLVAEFGFDIIYEPSVRRVNEPYNPSFGIGKGVQVDIEEIIEEVSVIGVGSKFYDTREDSKKQIFSDKGSRWTMCYIGTMQKNYEIDKMALKVAVDSGIWKRI